MLPGPKTANHMKRIQMVLPGAERIAKFEARGFDPWRFVRNIEAKSRTYE